MNLLDLCLIFLCYSFKSLPSPQGFHSYVLLHLWKILIYWKYKPLFKLRKWEQSWQHSQSLLSFNYISMYKASGGDGIPTELFKTLKDSTVKMLHSICHQTWITQQWSQDWKMSVFIPIPKKGNAKECSNYHTVILISHTSRVMLKILQARLQIENFQMYKLYLERAEESGLKLPTSVGS